MPGCRKAGKELSQAAARDGGGAGPGARWLIPFPGHLAATMAKQVLLDQKVVVMCSEGINISGNFYRNKLKYLAYHF